MKPTLNDRLYDLLRPLLFRLDPERSHNLVLGMAERAPHLLARMLRGEQRWKVSGLTRRIAGLELPGPVGLAAGLDKNGVAIPVWSALGFAFAEVGTVTALPQPGNPRPRLFRLVEERALINRMGFNNQGSEAMARRLRALRQAGAWPDVPVGVNVGKSKVARVDPLDEAIDDYVTSIRRVAPLADYLAVNVSSPNTPELRRLQEKEALGKLLPAVVRAARGTPVFLKVDPDLDDEALRTAVDLAVDEGIAALIATNTTLRRDLLRSDPGEAGGLSGRPLWSLARRRIGVALEASAGRLPVIGVGGISSAVQVRELLEAGCAAVQLYSALIFEGPGLPRRIHHDLARGGVTPRS